jgi:integrase
MLPDQPSAIDEWTRSPLTGVLSCSVGRWGERKRLFQKRAGSPFYCSVYLTDGRRHVSSLGTTDHAEALRMVKHQVNTQNGLSVLDGHNSHEPRPDVTLGRLWERYRRECETFRDTDQAHQSDTATRSAILIAYFGADYDVERLSKDAQRRYERARVAGGLRYRRERRVIRFGHVQTETALQVSQPTRARSAEADLVLLHAMLIWATTVRDPSAPSSTRWLAVNPLKGIERRPEKNPRRPVTCQERFDATRRAIQARSARAPDGSAERLKWIRLELALVLAEATGRRIGAIRQLRWEDIDYATPAITWRADADKMGILWTIDLAASLVAELRHFQARLGGIGGCVFPAARFPDQPTDRWAMVKCLLQAERDAGLPKLVGGVWHPYRRKWAMERKQWPLRDVATVGGWKSLRSLIECYAQADRDTMRAVVNETRKILSTDLQPSQLATREPWSPPTGRSYKRCSAPANHHRCTTRRTRSGVRVARGATQGSETK